LLHTVCTSSWKIHFILTSLFLNKFKHRSSAYITVVTTQKEINSFQSIMAFSVERSAVRLTLNCTEQTALYCTRTNTALATSPDSKHTGLHASHSNLYLSSFGKYRYIKICHNRFQASADDCSSSAAWYDETNTLCVECILQ
jgi:hypothetical protein